MVAHGQVHGGLGTEEEDLSRRRGAHKEHGEIHGILKSFVFLCVLCVPRASVRNIGSKDYEDDYRQ